MHPQSRSRHTARFTARFTGHLPLAAALSLASLAGPALACNPDGCGGLSAEELARDKAEIERLNREQLRYVRSRDAEYARGWQARRDHAQAISDYERSRADYERRMAEWREAVRRCEAGEYRYCAG
ncbi:hypothetical protein [Qipengyuania sp. ASV99]|uniref:hypothetical protein n=1 Tax=Qipengyuania sp. ASV99 TaxID=3399681 RepID=UPI003A4C7B86